MRIGVALLLAWMFLAGPIARGADRSLLPDSEWVLFSPDQGQASLDLHPPGADQGDEARLTVVTPTAQLYQIQLNRTVHSPIAADTLVRLRLRVCSSVSEPVRIALEQANSPYEGYAEARPTLTHEWQTIELTATLPALPANGLAIRVQAGLQRGVVEAQQTSLDDLGPDPAVADARAAIEPTAIQQRIDRYRKRDIVIHVQDSAGRPVPGATVSLTQTREAFLFGCNIFGLNPTVHDAHQQAYQRRFTDLFNYATLPFYWSAFEPTPGRPQNDRLHRMAQWCNAHNLTCKGHPLIWHQAYPSWAPTDADTMLPLLQARVTQIVSGFTPEIHFFDVMNEANAAAVSKNGVGNWVKNVGPSNAVATALGWARAADKNHADTFIYNDFNTTQLNLALLRDLKSRGTLPDAIGIQSHMHAGEWPLTNVWMTAQAFSAFGRPVHFTETTVLSGEHRPIDETAKPRDWPSTSAGEAAQADYLSRFYELLFSCPAVQAITYWDFSDDGAWLGAPAGLLHKDMTPKPAYNRLIDLIRHQWMTTAAGPTNAAGDFTVRGFLGDYTATATFADGHVVDAHLKIEAGDKPQQAILRSARSSSDHKPTIPS